MAKGKLIRLKHNLMNVEERVYVIQIFQRANVVQRVSYAPVTPQRPLKGIYLVN